MKKNELQAEEKQTELAEWAMQVAEHEERLPELEEAQATLNAAFQTQQDEANRIRRELALKQQQLAHAGQTVAKHEERKGRLKQENQALNLPDEAETAAAQEAAVLLQSQQEHYEEQIIAAEEALHAAREAFQTTSSRFQSLKQQHITLQAQQQALSQILSQQQEAADFWQATDHAAAPQLWQHITAPAEWQHALSVILAERLHARSVRTASCRPHLCRRDRRYGFQTTSPAASKIPARTGIAEPKSKHSRRFRRHCTTGSTAYCARPIELRPRASK